LPDFGARKLVVIDTGLDELARLAANAREPLVDDARFAVRQLTLVNVARGHERPIGSVRAMSALTPHKRPNRCVALSDALGQLRPKCIATIGRLFDHLVDPQSSPHRDLWVSSHRKIYCLRINRYHSTNVKCWNRTVQTLECQLAGRLRLG
jgi:hypothetical protein